MKVDWWRVPWLIGLIAGAAIGTYATPGWSEALQYDRAAIRAGRGVADVDGARDALVVGPPAEDVAALVVAGWWGWRLDRRATAAVLVLSPLVISAALWVAQPGMERYRGLSGVDTGLFALVAVGVAASAWRGGGGGGWRERCWRGRCWGEAGYEWATGSTLFARSVGVFEPVPLAHGWGGEGGGGWTVLGLRFWGGGTRRMKSPSGAISV